MNYMDSIDMAKILSSLMQLDINAAYAFEQAIESTDLIALREKLISLRDGHNQHVLALSKVIKALGVVPPEYSRDFKGVLMEGFTAIGGGIGIEGALKAMRSNEEHVAKKYREAYSLAFTPNISELVEKCYRDVQGYLEFLDRMIADRAWDRAA